MKFKTEDYEGVTVILSSSTWHKKLLDPIIGHPEVKPFLPRITSTIQSPGSVYQSIRDSRSKLFISKITKGTYASYYFVVVVKYVKENDKSIGYVATVMINRKLPKASIKLWEKTHSN